MYPPKRLVGPQESLLTLQEVKEHLQETSADFDAQVAGFMAAAEAYLDGYSGVMGRCLVTQTWAQSFDAWPGRFLQLAFPDVQSVTVTYRDEAGDAQTYDAANYSLHPGPLGDQLWLKAEAERPGLDKDHRPITIQMVAGYGDRAAVPENIRLAAKMLVATWYRQRESVSELAFRSVPDTVPALIAPFRRISL